MILSTCPSSEANNIARKLVESRLCACVNVVPRAMSYYHWNGKLNETEESILIMKSTDNLKEELFRKLRDSHSYEVPEFIVLPIEWGSPRYLNWIADETRSKL